MARIVGNNFALKDYAKKENAETINGLWNFANGLQVNGEDISSMSSYPPITAPDSTTLTNAQVTKIIAGCKIEGNYLGFVNPLLLPVNEVTDYYQGIILGALQSSSAQVIREYVIDKNTNVISVGGTDLQLNDLGLINANVSGYGLSLPSTSGFNANKTIATVDDITSAIATVKQNAFIDVNTSTYPTLADFLASTGEEGNIYLYPIDNNDLTKGYKQYIWESNAWRYIGDTVIDLTGYGQLAGNNTWTNNNTFSYGAGFGNSTKIYLDGNNNLVINPNGYKVIMMGMATPHMSNILDLGFSNLKWKDLYLAGKINPNSSSYGLSLPTTTGWTANKEIATTDHTFNVINASDIENNTLTQAQYNLITNGKPTLINGTLRGLHDITLFSGMLSAVNEFRGSFIAHNQYGQSYFGTYVINTSLIISLNQTFYTDGSGRVVIANFYSVNGKNIPSFPSDTTKQYKFVQKVGGNLDYLSDYAQPYATNSTTVLEYETINNISISANTTFTLATAPADTYPEYKANITNTDNANAITITLPSGTKTLNVLTNSIGTNTISIGVGETIELTIQNGKAKYINWGV